MGIFDFLGDLSSKRSKELGLGGLQSLLGTRGAAKAGDTGDEMMKITGGDSLPGYYNQETREYVPWYVDLFDGGGLNAAGGAASAEAAGMPAAGASLLGGGAQPGPNVQPGPALGSQLSDMERLNRMPGVDPRNLGGASGYGPMGVDPRNLGGAEGYGPMGIDQRNMGGASGYGQTGVAPGGTIVPLDEILTPEEIARRDAEAKMAQIKSGNFTFADLMRMANSGQLAESNRAALNRNASTSNPSLPQSQNVGPTEFERFKSKFEKELKANGLWGFPNKIQETFDGLKSRGLNY